MKNVLIVLLITFSYNLFGLTLNVSSSVKDLNNNPISNHWVFIESLDSSFTYVDSIATDVNGNYTFIVNGVPSQNIQFAITTYDCNNTIHTIFVFASNSTATPFQICSNSAVPNCHAQFSYYQDTINPNTYYFINQSSNYTQNMWFVNNSIVSNQVNLTHTFSVNPSLNSVCLLVIDSLNNCSDSSCAAIVVNNCSVSLSNTINGLTVSFVAQSVPLADYYEWDFGDGAAQTTTTASITHTYSGSGTYTASLTTLNIYNQAQDTCTAYATNTIIIGSPTNTGSIYGYVFADSNYLNSGIIELYIRDIATQKMILIDSTQIVFDSTSNNSYFIFDNKTYNDYYIKCKINPGSSYYGSYYDTWYPHDISWLDAQKVELNSSVTAANIILKEPEIFFNGGNGSIEGGIIAEQGIDATATIVYLYSAAGYLADKSSLDVNGKYYFDSLIVGTYTLKPELINYNAISFQISISQQEPSHTNVNIGLGSNGFYLGNHAHQTNINLISIFPNPVKDELNISVNLKTNENILIAISDILGRVVYKKTTYAKSKSFIKVSLKELNSGVYIVSISDRYGSVVKKVIKQ